MAESAVEQQQPEIEISKEGEAQAQAQAQAQPELKYLGFVAPAATKAIVYVSWVYDHAKESTGPLKPGVQAVEGTVKAVVGPVYDKFHGVPHELLRTIDRKVEESVSEMDRRIPSSLKQASVQACAAARKAPQVARSAAAEIQHAGVVGAAAGLAKTAAANCEPAAKELYARYEPVAEHCAVSAWRTLNRLPLFPRVAEIAVPVAAQWSEKYNDAVGHAAEKGYAAAAYMPLVPTERIARVFASAEA